MGKIKWEYSKNCTAYNITRTSYDSNISALFSGAKDCENDWSFPTDVVYFFRVNGNLFAVGAGLRLC